jgi:hypothetical protein
MHHNTADPVIFRILKNSGCMSMDPTTIDDEVFGSIINEYFEMFVTPSRFEPYLSESSNVFLEILICYRGHVTFQRTPHDSEQAVEELFVIITEHACPVLLTIKVFNEICEGRTDVVRVRLTNWLARDKAMDEGRELRFQVQNNRCRCSEGYHSHESTCLPDPSPSPSQCGWLIPEKN